MDKVDGILSSKIDELSLSFRRMEVKLTKEVVALTKTVQTLEKSRGKDLEYNQGSAQTIGELAIRIAEEEANKNEEKLHEEIFLLRELVDYQSEAEKNHMSDFKVLFRNNLSSATQMKNYEDEAKTTMVKIESLEDSYKLLIETIHVEFDKSLDLLRGIKSKLEPKETTFNEAIERLDKKYNSLLLRAAICEEHIEEN
ncbi:unnamed protein product [Arabidopsis thaliana]|uniref:(thale cress) hypothetical protein n=1 Tax=Arabidopsis thaliana TaxID=3702 RepID=A0A7G2DZU0_ARATH|nr:unnamed protein product [Arabidopsis thaliana]